jgi:hypothetical protein
LPSSVNIAEVSRVAISGHVFSKIFHKKVDSPVNKQVQVEHPVVNPYLNKDKDQAFETIHSDFDEFLKLINKSEYKAVDQLMQTPSKNLILSLLLNSDVHREALIKVLDQAFVDHDVTIDQFGGILPNQRIVQCACRHHQAS